MNSRLICHIGLILLRIQETLCHFCFSAPIMPKIFSLIFFRKKNASLSGGSLHPELVASNAFISVFWQFSPKRVPRKFVAFSKENPPQLYIPLSCTPRFFYDHVLFQNPLSIFFHYEPSKNFLMVRLFFAPFILFTTPPPLKGLP